MKMQGISYQCQLFIEKVPPHLVTIEKVYFRWSIIYITGILPNYAKVVVQDVTTRVHLQTEEVQLVG